MQEGRRRLVVIIVLKSPKILPLGKYSDVPHIVRPPLPLWQQLPLIYLDVVA
jgi:hypothetical protein